MEVNQSSHPTGGDDGGVNTPHIDLWKLLSPLLEIEERALTVDDVSRALTTTLKLERSLGPDGDTYLGLLPDGDTEVELFTRNRARSVLTLTLRGHAWQYNGCYPVSRLGDELARAGWTRFSVITHPMMQDSYGRDDRQVRFQHNSRCVVLLELLTDIV